MSEQLTTAIIAQNYKIYTYVLKAELLISRIGNKTGQALLENARLEVE